MLLYTCPACERGNHKHCAGTRNPPPGVFGGSKCDCSCNDPKPLTVIEERDSLVSTTPRTDAFVGNNLVPSSEDDWQNFARQLETELIALQEENRRLKTILCTDSTFTCLNHNDQERAEVKCGVCLKKERDQLLATVESLTKSSAHYVEQNLKLEATVERLMEFVTHPESCKLSPCNCGLDSVLQSSLPPTNLVKRSVLENLLNAFQKASGNLTLDAAFNDKLLAELNAVYKEAHEELQRTAK